MTLKSHRFGTFDSKKSKTLFFFFFFFFSSDLMKSKIAEFEALVPRL